MNYFAIFLVVLVANTVISAKLVLELTPDNFNTATNKTKGSTMVMFYASWCTHCQHAKPHFEKAAIKMAEVNISNHFALLNCDDEKNTNLCSSHNIEGYPTFKLFTPNNVTYTFNSEATEENLLKFFSDPTLGPASVSNEDESPDVVLKHTPYLNAETFSSTLKKMRHALVFFYAPWCPHCQDSKPMVDGASEKLSAKDRAMFAVNCEEKINKKFCDDEKIEGFPTIRYYHLGEMFAEYDDRMETDSFLKYLSKPPKEKVPLSPPQSEVTDENEAEDDKLQHAQHITSNEFDALLKTTKDHFMVMFFVPMCSHCKDAKPIFDSVAQEIQKTQPERVLAVLNCMDKLNEKLCQREKIGGFPTFVHYFNGKRVKEYNEHPLTKEKLVRYFSTKTKEEL